jgi:hypothetical protein
MSLTAAYTLEVVKIQHLELAPEDDFSPRTSGYLRQNSSFIPFFGSSVHFRRLCSPILRRFRFLWKTSETQVQC